jgi:hypothetical protein
MSERCAWDAAVTADRPADESLAGCAAPGSAVRLSPEQLDVGSVVLEHKARGPRH